MTEQVITAMVIIPLVMTTPLTMTLPPLPMSRQSAYVTSERLTCCF